MKKHVLSGRAKELSELREVLARTTKDAGGSVIVEGPAGIGKSCLLGAAVEEALAIGIAVCVGRADELDHISPLSTLLRVLRGELAAGLAVADLLDADRHQVRLVDLLAERIAAYAATRPLLIVIDDAHLADELSVLALRSLVPALVESRVTWLLSRRSSAGGQLVRETLDQLVAEWSTWVFLGPLDERAINEMCANVLGEPDSRLRELIALSKGDPSLLADLLTSLRDAGMVDRGAGSTQLRPGALPRGFLDAVNRRLRGLSSDARSLLDAASVFRHPFSVHELAGLLGRRAADVLDAVTELLDAEVLTEVGSQLMFHNGLIRDAVYERLSGPVRVALHREAVAVLRAEHGSTSEIAQHVVLGGWSGADLLSRLAVLFSVEFPVELFADVVRMLMAGGRLADAMAVIGQEGARRADPTPVGALLLEVAEVLTYAAQDIDVLGFARATLTGGLLTDETRAALLSTRALGLVHRHELAEADQAAREALTHARRIGADAAAAMALVCRSVAAIAGGDLDTAIAHARAAVAEVDGVRTRHRPHVWLARILISADRFEEAKSVQAAGQRLDDAENLTWTQPFWHVNRAVLRLAGGQLAAATAEAEAAVQDSARLNSLYVRPLAMLGYLAMLRNDVATADHHLRRAVELAAEASCGMLELNWRIGVLQFAEGRLPEAIQALHPVYESLPQRPLGLGEEPHAAAVLVRIALAGDNQAQAVAAAFAAAQASRLNPNVMSLAGAADHAEGLLRGDSRLLHSAARRYAAVGWPLAWAMAVEDEAAVLARSGQEGSARSLLDQAYDCYVRLGTDRDAARVDQVRRKLAEQHPKPSDRLAELGGDRQRLTEAETRVVDLVIEGLTNREVARRLYLSPHTVDSHLRSSFAKLGVSSRVQLTRRVLAATGGYPEKA